MGESRANQDKKKTMNTSGLIGSPGNAVCHRRSGTAPLCLWVLLVQVKHRNSLNCKTGRLDTHFTNLVPHVEN